MTSSETSAVCKCLCTKVSMREFSECVGACVHEAIMVFLIVRIEGREGTAKPLIGLLTLLGLPRLVCRSKCPHTHTHTHTYTYTHTHTRYLAPGSMKRAVSLRPVCIIIYRVNIFVFYTQRDLHAAGVHEACRELEACVYNYLQGKFYSTYVYNVT